MPSLLSYTMTCTALCVAFGFSSPASGVVAGNAVSAEDRRLDAVGIVLTMPTEFSIPCGGWISGTGTLVGPDLVILARHSVVGPTGGMPAAGSRSHRIRFRRGVNGEASNRYTGDCGAPFQEIFVQEFLSSPSGLDVVLGRLESAPVGIAPIQPDVNYIPSGSSWVTLTGWGYDGLCYQTGDAWTLRNKSASLPFNPHPSYCCFEYNAASASGACYSESAASRWAIGNLHDSGAPLLTEVSVGGRMELRLVGVVNTSTLATMASAWNQAGGQPQLPVPVVTPPACRVDYDRDGRVTIDDLHGYLMAYFNNAWTADFDQSGTVTVRDMFQFVQAFFRGC